MTLANYLYALVYSNMYDENDWQHWGEKLLENAVYDDDSEWVYDVVFTVNKQKLFEVLSERIFREDYLSHNTYTLTEIIQGYYYYQYLHNQINLYELLNKSGDVADAGEDSKGCEFFYDLLNKIDKNSNIINDAEFVKIIHNYFNPLCMAAIEQKRKFELAQIEDLILDI